MSSENTTRYREGSDAHSFESTFDHAIFLGGPAGAGKTSVTNYLTKNGWYGLDMDGKGTNRVLELLDAPVDHPLFQPRPLVVEGGFLEQAPKFQSLIERLDLTTFWLTGTKGQLTQSRLKRKAFWDDRNHILNSDWIGLIETYRKFVRWDYEINMWHPNGKRKSFEEVESEIVNCLTSRKTTRLS